MVRVRTLVSEFFAGYGYVSAGTIIEMTGPDALISVIDGIVERVD